MSIGDGRYKRYMLTTGGWNIWFTVPLFLVQRYFRSFPRKGKVSGFDALPSLSLSF